MKKNVKKFLKNNKNPIVIGAIGAGVVAVAAMLGKAFKSMKASTRAQHEADKAEFQAVKAESKANFEENRGHNTYAKAKADAKKSWDDAHMSPSERTAKMREENIARVEAAKK